MASRRLLFVALFSLMIRSSLGLTEAEALLKVKAGLDQGGAASALATWTPDSSPCKSKWAGVMCFNGIITGLHLTGMNLSGAVDVDALLQIRGLRTISLVNNSFSGQIPEFNRIGVVKSLLLTGNSFSGEIPPDFFSQLGSLKKVWLNSNKFSGKIPDSVRSLKNLLELHLENNRFSGAIPEFPKPIPSLDLSNNLLEGPIPEVFSSVHGLAFTGNDGLCGKPVGKPCPDPTASSATSAETSETALAKEKNNHSKMIFAGLIGMMVLVGVISILSSKKDEDFADSGSEFSRKTTMSALADVEAESSPPPPKTSRNTEETVTDLIMVKEEKGMVRFGLSDLMKAAAEVMGSGNLGSAYKAVMTSGVSVAVKRMREMNRLGREAFDAEMRRLGRLRHPNILTPLAYHYRREEKLLVSHYIPKGSLLYVLHGDRGSVHAELNWETRLKIAKGVARGLGFLYSEFPSLELPHGNLKSSNVLLSDDHEPLLSDYALGPLMSPASAAKSMFAYRTPDRGAVSRKTDVFCLGLILLEILTGKFPSQYHTNGKGGTDVVHWALSAAGDGEAELLDPDMLATAGPSAVAQMRALLRVGIACVEPAPHLRIDLREAISRIEQIR